MLRSPHVWNGAAVDIVAMLYEFCVAHLSIKERYEHHELVSRGK